MKEIEIQKLIDMNYRALLLLGYSLATIQSLHKNVTLCDKDEEKYQWIKNAILNINNFDQPLPLIP